MKQSTLSSVRRITGLFVILIMLISSMTMHALQSGLLPKGSSIINSDVKQCTIRIKPIVSGFDTIITAEGTITVLPNITDAIRINQKPGSPYLVQYSIPITVPSADGFQLLTTKTGIIKSIDGIITPSPKSIQHANDEIPQVEYSIDETAYAQSNQERWAEIKYSGIARNRHIAHLIITIARFDSHKGIIEIPSMIECRIQFSVKAHTAKSYTSQDFDPIISVNHDQTRNWKVESPVQLAKKQSLTALNQGPWAKITINEHGVYSIDKSLLSAAGITVNKDQLSTIKIFGLGGTLLHENPDSALNNTMVEQPIIVKTKADGELDAIVFYAEGVNGFRLQYDESGQNIDFRHFTHPYAKESSYLITVGGSNGLRANALPSISKDSIVHRPTTFTARVFNEEELVNAFADPSGKIWFGQTVESVMPRVYSTVLPGFTKTGTIRYRYRVAHKTSNEGTFTISENGNQIDAYTLSGLGSGGIYTEAYASPIREVNTNASGLSADNRSLLKFSYKSSAGLASSGFVDWFEILYNRTLNAENNQLEVFTNHEEVGGTEYSINQFFGSEIIGFDITNPRYPSMLTNTSSTGGMFVIRYQQELNKPRRYYISSSYKTPKLTPITLAGLRDDLSGATMLLITHKDLLEAANEYKEYRATTGMSVHVVTIDQIYNEFAGGIHDITAIRDYAAFALENWTVKPHYMMFLGDGHYDYKGIQIQKENYVPTYQLDGNNPTIFSETVSACVDDYFSRIKGNDSRVDIASGRVSVNSLDEAKQFLKKLIHYEQNVEKGQWQTTVCLVADDGPVGAGNNSEGTIHTGDSESLASNSISSDMQLRKIYLAEYPAEIVSNGRRKPAVTQQLLTDINTTGAVLLNWVGHGSPRLWAHERIFEKETTIPQMMNWDKLFFLTAATCDFGRFDDPEKESGAEELIRSNRGGAIGVFAATRLVYSGNNAAINSKFYQSLFERDSRGNHNSVGDALYITKQTLYGDNDEKFLILGDPSLQLQIPNNVVSFDTINGLAVQEGLTIPDTLFPQIKALQKVTIKGSIKKAVDSTIIQDFNGTVLITMKDCDITLQVKDATDGYTHTILENGGILTRSTYAVNKGTFTASFVIPKDISFSNKIGRMFGYAFEQSGNRTAKGNTQYFTVGGIENNSEVDSIGPSIDIFLDNRTFKPGDLVRRNPLLIVDLRDNTAINATGAGIGHNIEAWFNTERIPVNLTDNFETELSDSRKGTAQKRILNLKSGTNTVRVRAWDVWNNYSESETYFRLADNDTSFISEGLFIYPNPTSSSATIGFVHNQTLPTQAEIRIFAIDGRLIRSASIENSELHTWTYHWDGRDNDGASVSSGIYICSIHAQNAIGFGEVMYGKLMLVR